MQPDTGLDARPLLTIAVPTFNRARYLGELLSILGPQLDTQLEVELLISDNASEDGTAALIANFRAEHPTVEVIHQRHAVNIGSDANFASCFARASGHFFWLCGDDDIIVPGALDLILPHLRNAAGTPADVDILYATTYGFRHDFIAEARRDPLGRRFHTVTNPRDFATIVNIMFTFISGIIVNKSRLESFPHEDPAAFIGTNLVQLAWSLPLLTHFRKGIVLYGRPVAGRMGNAHGYRLGSVFGDKLAGNVARLLPGSPDLARPILHFALRRWFPAMFIEFRSTANQTLGLNEAHHDLRRNFGRNPRYWLFTYPALKLPLPAARLYTKLTAALCKAIYIARLPGFWRKQT